MHHGIYGERQIELHDLGRKRALSGEGAVIARDMVGGRSDAVLNGNLHVIETGRCERGKTLRREADGGRDEIAIESGLVGGGRDRQEIAPGGRVVACGGALSLRLPNQLWIFERIGRLSDGPRAPSAGFCASVYGTRTPPL